MDKAEYILTHYNELKGDLEMLKYRLENFKPVTENEVLGHLSSNGRMNLKSPLLRQIYVQR